MDKELIGSEISASSTNKHISYMYEIKSILYSSKYGLKINEKCILFENQNSSSGRIHHSEKLTV